MVNDSPACFSCSVNCELPEKTIALYQLQAFLCCACLCWNVWDVAGYSADIVSVSVAGEYAWDWVSKQEDSEKQSL